MEPDKSNAEYLWIVSRFIDNGVHTGKASKAGSKLKTFRTAFSIVFAEHAFSMFVLVAGISISSHFGCSVARKKVGSIKSQRFYCQLETNLS